MSANTGLVGGIQRFSISDGPGIRTTVFLKGCPLSCAWCHNPELISPKAGVIFNTEKCIGCYSCVAACTRHAIHKEEESATPVIDWSLCVGCQTCGENCMAEAINPVGKWMAVNEVLEEIIKDKGFYEKSGGGVTFSGGEMLMQYPFAEAIMDACIENGITVTLDTCGQGDSQALLRMAKRSSDILYDMKMIRSNRHKELTGVSNNLILRNLTMLAENREINPKIQIRMPLISGVNDTDEIISETSDFYLASHLKRVTLLPYHRLGISKTRHLGGEPIIFQPPTDERLDEIRRHFSSNGIEVEILGEEIS